MSPPVLGVVTGLAFEAEVLRRTAAQFRLACPLLAIAGLGPGRARDSALRLGEAGATHLLSFGIATALDPTLGPGATVVAQCVGAQDGRTVAADVDWALRLATLPGAVSAVLAHADHVLASAGVKAALRSQVHGAIAADMESMGVAEAAQAAGLPFAVLRVISDGAEQGIPPAALAGTGPDGRTRITPVLRALIGAPWQLPALVALAASTAKARARLAALARLGLPRGFFAEP
jgi:pyruvate/2-oxoglutarate dehydrogenase complex dihydrolipoamide acyltransferase (E2) component